MTSYRSLLWLLLALLVVGAAVFIAYPHESYYTSYYLPFIFKHIDARLYPTDLFVNSEPVLHSFFFPMVALLLKYADLKILFPALCFIETCANLVLVYLISRLLFKNWATTLLAIALLFFGKHAISICDIGILNAGRCEATGLARPFLLFAIYLFLKERHLAACLITGLMFYIQGMEAFFVSIMFLTYFLVKIRRFPLSRILYSVLLLGLPVLPLAWNVLSQGFLDITPPEVVNRWLPLLYFRFFYHIFPSTWGVGDWYNYSGWFIWAYIVLRYSRPSEKHDVIMVFCKAIGLLCLIGTYFVEVIPVPIVVKLVLWRSTIFFVLFLVIYISDYLVHFPAEKPFQLMLLTGTAASLFFNSFSFYRLIPCFALMHLAYHQRHRKAVFYLLTLAGIAGVCVFTVISLLPLEPDSIVMAKLVSFAGLNLKDLCLFYCSIPAFLSFFYLRGMGRLHSRSAALPVTLAIMVFFIWIAWPKDVRREEFNRDWKDVQLWAKSNTPVETVFIVPPHINGFRAHSQRGIVSEDKDGTICINDVNFTFKWWERMSDLGFSNTKITVLDFVPESRRNYAALSRESIVNLRRKYGVGYIVTEEPRGADFRLVYENRHFYIYSLIY